MMKKIFLLCLIFILVSCTSVSGADFSETARVIGRDISYDSSGNYAYMTLSDSEKAAYDKLKNSAVEMNGLVEFDDPLSKEQIVKVFNLVYTQENGIFWLDSIASPLPEENAIRISFRYKREDVKYMQGVLNEKLNEIINGIPDGADDFTKIKYIHDYIVLHSDFTKDGENVNSAYGVLVDGFGQCDGYAFAFGLLASKTGLSVVVVNGTNKEGETHAWNKVKSDGEWYNIDTTWDDPVIDYDNPGYLRNFYMLVPDKEIIGITHFENINNYVSPAASAFTDNYFYHEKLIFDTADDGIKVLSEQILDAAFIKATECEIRFSSKTVFDEAVRKLYDEGELKEITEKVNAGKSSAIKNIYTAKDETLHIIHLSLVY
jgi:predicted small secreted protein